RLGRYVSGPKRQEASMVGNDIEHLKQQQAKLLKSPIGERPLAVGCPTPGCQPSLLKGDEKLITQAGHAPRGSQRLRSAFSLPFSVPVSRTKGLLVARLATYTGQLLVTNVHSVSAPTFTSTWRKDVLLTQGDKL